MVRATWRDETAGQNAKGTSKRGGSWRKASGWKRRNAITKGRSLSTTVPIADVSNWRRRQPKRVEKEKRDKEMKVAVDRLWQHYFAESAGKIRGKAEAREGGTTRRSVRKKQSKAEERPRSDRGAQRSLGLGVYLVRKT